MSEENINAFGGVLIQVTMADGAQEQVKVRQLPVKLFPEYMGAFEDEVATAALFTDKPKEWVDRLSIESHQEIIDQGEKLNLPFLKAYAERSRARREKLIPGFSKMMETAIASSLSTGLPTSQSKRA